MHSDCIIIGGGLSGLSAAWQLHRAGKHVTLIEARTRLGGRILSIQSDTTAFDAGPSWFWPGQPLIAGMLDHFSIGSFQQYAKGDLLYQTASGQVNRHPDFAPMANARRIQGGVATLIDALSGTLDARNVFCEHQATSLSLVDEKVTVSAAGPNGKKEFTAPIVAVALPPRLAGQLRYTPALPEAAIKGMTATPTWMAGHAKFYALYDAPFWRAHKLSGDIMSQIGPLAEVHDASPREGGPYALFGFLGLDAATRSRVGHSALIDAAVKQLTDVFGAIALAPNAAFLQDWSTEPYTATPADFASLSGHPKYGPVPPLDAAWHGKLDFIATETAPFNGGLLEGALERGMSFAQGILEYGQSVSVDVGDPRSAGMSWNFFDPKN